MVFHWSLSDSNSPQVSRTLLTILAIRNNAVVWMVSTRPPTSKSSSPFSNPLVTIPNAPITIGIIVTCMFHSFFNSLARSRYLSFFSHSFSFILWSAGTAKSTILIIIKSGLLAGIRWSACMSQRSLCVCKSYRTYGWHFLGQVLGCALLLLKFIETTQLFVFDSNIWSHMSVIPVSWGCRIHRLYLCRGLRPPNECLGYDTKQSDDEVSVMLELWGIQTIPLLCCIL